MTYRVAVLISGSGSNLQALIEQADAGGYEICSVISNNPDAYGLERASDAGILQHSLTHKGKTREVFDSQLLQCVRECEPDLVVLAGFMRILTSVFTAPLLGKLINIHPSLLPKYRGLNTHAQALKNQDAWHGASVHFVTEELDGGPVIAQAEVKIDAGDTEDTLREKVLVREHQLYPQTVRCFALGCIGFNNGKPLLKSIRHNQEHHIPLPVQIEQLEAEYDAYKSSAVSAPTD